MKTSTAGPLGVLSGAPASTIIVVDEDVDGGPPGGAYLSLHCSTWQLLQKKIVVATEPMGARSELPAFVLGNESPFATTCLG
jgi:hypothetical protein